MLTGDPVERRLCPRPGTDTRSGLCLPARLTGDDTLPGGPAKAVGRDAGSQMHGPLPYDARAREE
ncbi:hypothetical protein ABZ848_48900 [Streptomyces sp. NPDC047081]|uniref:hypothetical protein n=1 Tax=Streptomyces sp. NPDC047081 TaxID=3154706 RepID=UPI0033C0E75B